MGLDKVNGPPKKKLKQGQLSFTSPSTNKRKLSEEPEIEAQQNSKYIRTEKQKHDSSFKEVKNSDNEENIIVIDSAENSPVKSGEISNEKKSVCLDYDGKIDISSKVKESSHTDISSKALEINENETSLTEINCKSPCNSDSPDCHTSSDAISENEKINEANTVNKIDKEKVKQKALSKKEKLKAKEEKEKKRQADIKQKEDEKKKKEEEKRKKEEAKEEEKKKKEEEKRKKEEAKEEEKKKKEEEKKKKEEAKEEEKRKKEEAKEEEKRKKEEAKEEEKRKKEEAKIIEQKKELQARAAFASFFVPKRESVAEKQMEPELSEEANFMPFQIKSDMRLADISRTVINEGNREVLDKIGEGETFDEDLYLKLLKNTKHKPKFSEATWPLSALEEQHDVIIIESEENFEEAKAETNPSKFKHPKAKLLQFHENRRPPYWGTWRKKTSSIGPRCPLEKDESHFDYEVDSDFEWEDEEEGESLEGNDDADKELEEEEVDEEENGYLLDNVFVPHGYLSDEEAKEADENFSPEEQKIRMVVLKEQFDEEMNQKAERLKPRLLGCVWINNETTEVSPGSLYQKLISSRALWNESCGPIDLIKILNQESSPPTTPLQESKKKQFPLCAVEPLVKFVHGSKLSLSQLVQEFLRHIEKENIKEVITKNAVTKKIKSLATRSVDTNGKQSWSVCEEFCKTYGLTDNEANLEVTGQEAWENSKNTFLDKFFKNGSSDVVAKRAPLSNKDSSEELNSTSKIKKETEVTKKRVSFITLSKTPVNQKQTVHQDTPRPSLNPFLDSSQEDTNKMDVIDLTSVTPKKTKETGIELINITEGNKNICRPLVNDFSSEPTSSKKLKKNHEKTPGKCKNKQQTSQKNESSQSSISSFFKQSPLGNKKSKDQMEVENENNSSFSHDVEPLETSLDLV